MSSAGVGQHSRGPPDVGIEERTTLLTVPRAAERLGVSRSTVYELMSAGRLPYVLIGRSRRIQLASLAKLIAASTRVGDR